MARISTLENFLILRTSTEKLLKNRDMVKGQFLARRDVFIRENGDTGKNMGREPRATASETFFILASGVLTRAALVVVLTDKENGFIVKTVMYMKENFGGDIGRARERCITGMERFIEENGVGIRNMGSER